jgi:hypothetical protein
MDKVILAEKLERITEHWRPKVVGELNGQEVKLVKFKGASCPVAWSIEPLRRRKPPSWFLSRPRPGIPATSLIRNIPPPWAFDSESETPSSSPEFTASDCSSRPSASLRSRREKRSRSPLRLRI